MGTNAFAYKRIPIVDAARRCGVSINSNTLGRVEVEAACPFCGDKLKRSHLNLNTSNDMYHCKLCGAGGNSVSLYARLNNISYKEAAEDLTQYCNVYPMPPLPRQETPLEQKLKPLPLRHDVFYEMLGHLALSDKHRSDLRGRGLSDERIARNMYRTLPNGDGPRRVLAGMLADFYDVHGGAGFYTDKHGRWNIDGKGGLLIPVCDMRGYIQGLQVRLDDEAAENSGRRYRWLSSRYKDSGTRSGNWIHVTGDVSRKTAFLTEGPLKGDTASFHDNEALFVCVAGINSADGLTDVIRSLGITELVLAADMDKVTNKQVRDGFMKITRTVSQVKGLAVRSLDWDVCFKGVDDYYHARQIAEQYGQDMAVRRNGITGYVHDLWRREYPLQESAFIDKCEWEEKIIHISSLIIAPPKKRYKEAISAEMVRQYKEQVEAGVELPPVICVNNSVIDGYHRCQAYFDTGTEYVRVYQNKPFALQGAA